LKQRRSGKRLVLILSIAVISLGGGAVFAYLKWFRPGTDITDVPAILMEADYALENGFYSEAANILEKTRSYTGSSQEWMRILKRAEAVSRGTEDFRFLRGFGKAAVGDLPGNEELNAVYTYALIRTGLYEDAYEHAARHIESELYHSLIAEAALNLGPDAYDPKELADNEFSVFLGGDPAGDPGFFEELAEEFQDDRLFAASAVAWMMEGNVERAVENAVKISSGDFTLLQYYIYYDYGIYDTAAELLEELRYTSELDTTEGLLLRADLEMAMGSFEKAGDTYGNIMEADPEASWIPYLNAAWIYIRQGDYEQAADALIRGYELFPEKEEVATAFSIFLLQITRVDIDNTVLLQLEEGLKEHEEMLGVYRQAVQASKSPERYRAILWELFNLHPENVKIAQYFAWYLLGIKDIIDLQLVLVKSEKRYGEMEWIRFFHGCIYAVRGQMETAEEYFLQALEKNDRWETAYNMALLATRYGNTDKAYEYFRRAELQLTAKKGNYSTIIAQIRVKMAWILYVNDQYDAAKRQVDYALEMDSGNLEGQLLRKKLEAETKR
jgi:tetratricopeptide (TPR) repeat protein